MNVSGTLNLAFGASMDYDLDTVSSSDEIFMRSGLLKLNGQQFSDFDFTPLSGFGVGTYTLIEAGSISGKLGNDTAGTIENLPAYLSVSGNDLVLNVVPEPGTAMLLAVSGLLGFAAWLRRRYW